MATSAKQTHSGSFKWVTEIAIVAPLVLICMLAAIVGLVDAVAAPQLGQRVLGMVLVTLSLILGLGIAFSYASQRVKPLSAVCFLAGSLIGAIFLVAQISAREPANWKLGVWIAMLIAPLALSTTLWIRGTRIAAGKQLATIISLVTLITGILQWLYSASYAPIREPNTLSIEIKTSPTEDDKAKSAGFQAIKSSFTIKNEGDVKLQVIQTFRMVLGINPKLNVESEANEFSSRLNDLSPGNIASRFEAEDNVELVEVFNDPLNADNWIPPKGQITEDAVAYVPLDRYNSYEFWYGIEAARADRISLNQDRSTNKHDNPLTHESFFYTDYGIRQSLLSRITQGRRYLEAQFYPSEERLKTLAPMELHFTASKDSHVYIGNEDALVEYYGEFQVQTVGRSTLSTSNQ